MRHQVLLVSDENSGIPRLVRDALALDDISITNASSAKEGMEVFRNIRPRVVLLDFSIPGIQECDMLESRVGLDAETEVIILTDHLSAKSKLTAIHKGL
jgi:DNA-binding NtrC family response regulator